MDAKSLITKHEGLRLYAYLDSLKIWSIAIGFNLERAGAKESLAAAGINYDMIWAAIEECKKNGGGRKPGEHTVPLINSTQADALLEQDLADVVKDLRILFPKFDQMPDQAKFVLQDMRYQLGPTRLRQFVNTLKAFKDGKWKDAANGIKNSAMYQQVPQRCNENIALLMSIK
jgi:GH24 family phage-related lysozyme (muramidase)